ncbi:DUF1870 family protein [Pediococcus pentosaceus]|uniref:helix-turn-helix transcriptional regulator n=1 Tax=Pediococcus pentosaceus TaxID=1255 RepID=UPI00130315D9|nr:helix-turn-helix transcriptional regulator [Pediococcus pentosaceus]QGZ69397.1 DUF1870 family protein [Pediococcus pentosaceus]
MKLTLKAIRANINLNQSEAAKRVGVSTDTWRNWENAKTFPDVEKIKKIENEFGVAYNQIIFLPNDTVKP